MIHKTFSSLFNRTLAQQFENDYTAQKMQSHFPLMYVINS